MATTFLWKVLGEKVIPVSKTAWKELSNNHKNLMISSKMPKKIACEVANPTPKIKKNKTSLFYHEILLWYLLT